MRIGFLTLASLILENTGLLKAGNQPTEFDPEKGGVVRFEDVLGCDEAKDEVSKFHYRGRVFHRSLMKDHDQ